MKLTERLNVLIQATTLSQKSGMLTLDDAVKAKTAIDIITSGNINQDFTSAMNFLIELAISSQKKGVFTLKDAHMIYLAVEGIENEFKNEINNLNVRRNDVQTAKPQVIEQTQPSPHVLDTNSSETSITIPPITITMD